MADLNPKCPFASLMLIGNIQLNFVTEAAILLNSDVCALNDEYSSFIKKPESESLLNAGVVPGSFSKWQADNDVRITDMRMGFIREPIYPFTYLLIYSFLRWLGNCTIANSKYNYYA